jgi:lipoprotein-releasing system permease protein
MIKPLSLFIGWRYTRAKKRNHFVSFISLASMLGIALGVTVLITVLSVMNGFDNEIRARFFTIAPHVTVTFPAGKKSMQEWNKWNKIIKSNANVASSVPFAMGNGVLTKDNQMNGLLLMGINTKQQLAVTNLKKEIVKGSLSNLASCDPHSTTPCLFKIAIAQSLAKKLNLTIGGQVTVWVLKLSYSPTGQWIRHVNCSVAAIYKSKGLGDMISYMNIKDTETLLQDMVQTGAHIRLHDIYKAPQVSTWLENKLGPDFYVTNWTTQFGPLSQALDMEKTILFFVLLLIVAVAAFNLVSTLVMVVTDKQADIAILKTLGAQPRTIMMSFIFQGMIIGITGIVLGVLGGALLASNISALSSWIQSVFHVQLISPKIYGINYLPSFLKMSDVVLVSSIAFVMCLLATLYPAWIAFRTQPAEALRYER